MYGGGVAARHLQKQLFLWKIGGYSAYKLPGKSAPAVFLVGVDIGNIHIVTALKDCTFRGAAVITEKSVGVMPGRFVGGSGYGDDALVWVGLTVHCVGVLPDVFVMSRGVAAVELFVWFPRHIVLAVRVGKAAALGKMFVASG